MRALVAGAAGAVGSRLCPALEAAGWDVLPTDLGTVDVTDAAAIGVAVDGFEPDVVFHLAAWKEAGAGELDPAGTCRVNVVGTANVVEAAASVGARVVLASTCKAADPETAYGASKLIAERIVLNAGGLVARFFNIPSCGPNVFSLWAELDEGEPIPYTDCWRYFITAEQAVRLLEACAVMPSGRYAADPGEPQHMRTVAAGLYPGRHLVEVPRRRGDRRAEPLHADSEYGVVYIGGMLEIFGAHDPVGVAA